MDLLGEPAEVPTVFVKCGSHRAREKLTRLLGGGEHKSYYSWDHPSKGGYYKIPVDKLAEARKIPGVSKSKNQDDLALCWTF